MADHKRLDLDVFAAAGRAAGCAFAVFYQEFVDGVAYQLGEAEENDVPLGGMAKSTQEVIPAPLPPFIKASLMVSINMGSQPRIPQMMRSRSIARRVGATLVKTWRIAPPSPPPMASHRRRARRAGILT